MLGIDESIPFAPVRIAVLTVSDTRTFQDDRSGDTLVARIEKAGHVLVDRAIVKDDEAAIVAKLGAWIADDGIDCVISTGGTGVTGRDVTRRRSAGCLREIGGLWRGLPPDQFSEDRHLRFSHGRSPGWRRAPTSSRCRGRPAR